MLKSHLWRESGMVENIFFIWRQRIPAAWALLCLLLSACSPPPYSLHPLSPPGGQPNDERLSGVWILQGSQEGHLGFIHISRDKEGWLEVAMVGPKSRGGLDASVLRGFTTTVGKDTFLNVRDFRTIRFGVAPSAEAEEAFPPEGMYLILLYTITEAGELDFNFMDDKFIEEKIRAGNIKGIENKETSTLKLTDTPENLIQFILKSDREKLFPKTLRIPEEGHSLTKLKIPPPPSSSGPSSIPE